MRDLKALRTDQTGVEREDRTRILVFLFVCFIGGMLVLFMVLPKEEFSNEERKSLQKMPEASVRSIFSGKYEEDAEEYISDHFPFRSFWIGLNSYASLYTGRTLINTVYIGRDSYYIQQPAVPDARQTQINAEAVRELQHRLGSPVRVLAVPETGYIMENKLPVVHLPYEDELLAETIKCQLGEDIEWIECSQMLRDLSASEQVFYRTDHHWTTAGAWSAYEAYCSAADLEPLERNVITVTGHEGFLGTTYAKVLLWDPRPDTIQLWQYPIACRVVTEDAETGWEPVTTRSFYDMGALSGYDPYMVFFGGNHGLMQIFNDDPEAEGSVLVIKDSYANCFLPFLAHNYKKITVVDPRYYQDLVRLTADETFDEALVLYGLGNLATDQDLGLIWL